MPSKSKVEPEARIASRLKAVPSQPKPVTAKPAPSPCAAANAAVVAVSGSLRGDRVARSTSVQS